MHIVVRRSLFLAFAVALLAASAEARPPRRKKPPVTSTSPAAARRDAPVLSDDAQPAEVEDVPLGPPPPPSEPAPKASGVPFFEDLVRRSPDDAEAHQALAAAYARHGMADEARRAARRAVELAPNNPEAQQALGLIEEGARNLAASEECFRRAVALDGNVEFRLDLARVIFLQSRLADAETEWQKIATEFAQDVEVQFALADAFRELGRSDEADSAYNRALELAPPGSARRIDILVEQGRMHADRGDATGALAILNRAKSEAPADTDVHYNLGVLFVRMAQTDAAVAAFQEALRQKPDFARAHNNLGVALEKAGRNEEALASFQKAVEVQPRFADALYNLGLVCFKLRRFQDARGAFEKVLAEAPELADAKFYLGEVYYQLGDAQQALRVYKEAVRTNPEDGAAHRRVGDLYFAQGDNDLAITEYWAAVDSNARDAANRTQLMLALLVRAGEGDVRRAVKLGEEGLALDPRALDVRKVLAQAEVQRGRSPRGRQILEEGVRVAPEDPRFHVALAEHLLKQGKAPAARQSIEAALRLDPKNAAALVASATLADLGGDAKEGIRLLQSALASDPMLPEARAELGRMLYISGKNAEALKELVRATQDAPHLGKAWFYLAFAQKKAGHSPDNVEKSLRNAVANQPDLAEAHFELGCIELAKKRLPEARRSFEAAVAARPSYDEPKTYLELILSGAAPGQCSREPK